MEQNIKSVTQELWLSYFNNVLFNKGIISIAEKNKMSLLINHYCHKS